MQKNELIINADDFGWNPANDQIISQLLLKRQISSASVLVNGINLEYVCSLDQKQRLPLGLHLNLTEGQALFTGEKNSLLVHSEMRGKFSFKTALNENQIMIDDIKLQIHAQIKKFIDTFQRLPSHIDGHQHVHLIPQVAEILAPIMGHQYGIYKTRFVNEELTDNQNQFYQDVIKNSQESEKIYRQYNIIGPQAFIGLNTMGKNFTVAKINQAFIKLAINHSVEIMTHPGQQNNYDQNEWYQSEERGHEATVLMSQEFQNILDNNKYFKIGFDNLSNHNENSKQNILLFCQMIEGTGNFTTSLRIKQILRNYNVYIRGVSHFDVSNKSSRIQEANNLNQFIDIFNISLVIGVNIYRTGIVLNEAQSLKKGKKIPYILIIAGTDANVYIKQSIYKKDILEAIEKSYSTISLNQEMKEIIMEELDKKGIKKKIKIIKQSVQENKIKSDFSLINLLKLAQNQKLIILPASFRQIKDIDFVLEPIKKLFQNEKFLNHHLVILGPILEEQYYISIKRQTKKINKELEQKRIHLLNPISHNQFLCIYEKGEVDLVLNSSINEGLSSSLLEAFYFQVPVLARNNLGNKSLITHGLDGYLFEKQEEFISYYEMIFTDNNKIKQMKIQQKLTLSSKYSYEIEEQKYREIVQLALNQSNII